MALMEAIAGAALLTALGALAIIDARTLRLPDIITLPLTGAGLVFAYLSERDIWLHVAAAAVAYGSLVALELTYRHLRGRDGLGRGDAKLFAAGGAWCGPAALPLILLAASLCALAFVLGLRLTRHRVNAETKIAFGPFLAFAIGGVWLTQYGF